jgi:PPOX class probable F420-dependent enzyme
VTPPRLRVPTSHRDLLRAPAVGVLTTLLPDGMPHSALVWLDEDDGEVRLNTTLERQSGRNLRRDPRLSLLAVDPADTGRYVQLRGDAELVLDGATDHLDRLTRAYTSHPSYYGHVFPREQATAETRVVVRILAERITLDAVHA